MAMTTNSATSDPTTILITGDFSLLRWSGVGFILSAITNKTLVTSRVNGEMSKPSESKQGQQMIIAEIDTHCITQKMNVHSLL